MIALISKYSSSIRRILVLLSGIGFCALMGYKTERRLRLWGFSLVLLIGLHMLVAGAGGNSRFIAPVTPYINILAAFGIGKLAAPADYNIISVFPDT